MRKYVTIEKKWVTKAGLRAVVCVLGCNYFWRTAYVEVKKGHPLYRKSYQEVAGDLDVHGGLTYSEKGGPAYATGWWFGFDAAHAGDAYFDEKENRVHILPGTRVIRSLEYMVKECERLAKQLVEYDETKR